MAKGHLGPPLGAMHPHHYIIAFHHPCTYIYRLLPWYLCLLFPCYLGASISCCYGNSSCYGTSFAVQAYTSSSVSASVDVWAFGFIAIKVFLGRNVEEQRRDVRVLGLCDAH